MSVSLAGDDDHLEARDLMRAGRILSLEELLKKVRREHPGRILEVELERESGRYVYEMDLLDEQGRVWELEYDAQSGELLEKERED